MNNPLVVLCAYCELGPAVTNRGNNGVLAHLEHMYVRRDDDPSHDWIARTYGVPQCDCCSDRPYACMETGEVVESKGVPDAIASCHHMPCMA